VELSAGRPDYAALRFPEPPAGRPYVIANLVMSVDGKVAAGADERGLGSPADQRLMRELRSCADVVLVGAETLRATGASSRLGDPALEAARRARGRAPLPTAAVLTASGALPLQRAFFTAQDFPALVYLAAGAAAERRAALAAAGRPLVEVPATDAAPALLHHARETLGARLLLCEGGPTLLGALLAADALDELFVTVAPRVIGGERAPTAVRGLTTPWLADATRLALASAAADAETGELYLRYRLLPRS
jgi:5-amino-6-(5-phosphoribosylamino)uracil reductase